MSGLALLELGNYDQKPLSDAALIHAVSEADIVQLQWPPPARYLYVLLALAPAHRLLVWDPEGNGPSCPDRIADLVLIGPKEDFDWPAHYRHLMQQTKSRRNPPRETFGHVRGNHDIGTVLFLALHGGRACPLRPEPPADVELHRLLRNVQHLNPGLFSGPLGVSDWVKACPNEPWLHLWMGLFEATHDRHTSALMHYGRSLSAGFRYRFLAWYLIHSATHRGAHHLTRRAVKAIVPYPLDLPNMESLTRRHRGSAADTPTYPLLDHVWTSNRVQGDRWRILRALSGWHGLEEVRIAWLAGAHLADEYGEVNRLCPNLQQIVLFEPHPELFKRLQMRFMSNRKVVLLPYALSDRNGESSFFICENEGLSSSLLQPLTNEDPLTVNTVQVPTRTMEEAAHQHRLVAPDFLILDIEGAEGQVLGSASAEFKSHIQLLYTQTSKKPLYQDSRTLDDIKGWLRQTHRFMGFAPERGCAAQKGHALFISHSSLSGQVNTRRLEVMENGQLPPLDEGEVANLQVAIRSFFLSDFAQLHQIEAKVRDIYIWGAGQMARALLPLLLGVDLQIKGFIDSDETLIGTAIQGIPVHPPRLLKGQRDKPVIVIASPFREEIEIELDKLGYSIPGDTVMPGFDILEVR